MIFILVGAYVCYIMNGRYDNQLTEQNKKYPSSFEFEYQRNVVTDSWILMVDIQFKHIV